MPNCRRNEDVKEEGEEIEEIKAMIATVVDEDGEFFIEQGEYEIEYDIDE